MMPLHECGVHLGRLNCIFAPNPGGKIVIFRDNNNNNNYDIQVLGIGAASKNRSWLALGRISLVDSSTHSRVFL